MIYLQELRGISWHVFNLRHRTSSLGLIITVNAGEMGIRCTPEHPFFVKGKGFVYASDLEPGNILVTEAGGCVMVTSVEADETVSAENTVTVYNFEVEDWYTYYVGEWCVLVHNACENHHFASNKNKKYSPRFEAIAKKFGLNLDADWNIRPLEDHHGRHTNAYHEWVMDEMTKIAKRAKNQDDFIKKFTKKVIQPVLDDTRLPYRK